MIAFRGSNKGWATPRLVSFVGLIQNFRTPTRIPAPFIWESPPRGSVPQNRLGDRLRLADDFSINEKNLTNRTHKMKTGRSPRRLAPEAFLLIVWENQFSRG